jgi:eukaryotic-like serine/threonine-protein kinase
LINVKLRSTFFYLQAPLISKTKENAMSEMLKPNQSVYIQSSEIACTVEYFLGSGGQGEVYCANLNGQSVALKWYFPHYLKQDLDIGDRLETAIKNGQPSDRFLWPIELTFANDIEGFGYIMPLRNPSYKGIVDLMKRRVEPTFRALATAGFELADSFYQLHARGFCYRDISFGNVFFDPETGHVLICDNDNVGIDNDIKTGVLGTPRFMAPEIVRGESKPSTKTDLFSLSVLLFYIFMVHHPLEGKRESEIRCFDLPAMTQLYGTDAVFIFDPQDDSNRPIPEYQQNAIDFWNIYPQFIRDLFVKAFTDGISYPDSGRVQETEWRSAMIRLRDSIIYCSHCGAENFYAPETLKQSGRPAACWSCGQEMRLPPRIRINKSRNVIMLNHDSQIFPHHINEQRPYDFSQPVACVSQNPKNPGVWGLKNLSTEKWVVTTADGTIKDVAPAQNITLAVGTKINFGRTEGEIRL